MNKVRRAVDHLTRSELEGLLLEANFSADQRKIFDLLNKDEYYDDGIMTALSMPEKRYYENKKAVLEKLAKLLPLK